jgi:hypothetical protein
MSTPVWRMLSGLNHIGEDHMLARRSFLTGLIAVTAPAIVRASSLMPVKALRPDSAAAVALDAAQWIYDPYLELDISLGYTITRQSIVDNILYGPGGFPLSVRVEETVAENLLSCAADAS